MMREPNPPKSEPRPEGRFELRRAAEMAIARRAREKRRAEEEKARRRLPPADPSEFRIERL